MKNTKYPFCLVLSRKPVMSGVFLLVVLRFLLAWFSIFDTAHLTDLGSKRGYRRLTGLKMSNNLLIHHADR